jgi:hypothetical protein
MVEFWISIFAGLVIVLLAIGIPYWLTHRRLRPHDLTEGRAYLDATGKTPEDAAAARPGRRSRRGGRLPWVHPGGAETRAEAPQESSSANAHSDDG